MKNKSLSDIQKEVNILILKLGGYWPPLAMLASVIEEIGELAREINSKEKIKRKKENEPKIFIGEEIADSIFSLLCLANYYRVDIESEFSKILKKYESRDIGRFT